MGVKDYSELRVYRVAFEAAMRIFVCSAGWPKEERYALTDQIRRSSRSVCGNLAEAWSKRRYPAHFVSKVSDAAGEARETEVWLDFSHACGYLASPDHRDLRGTYSNIGGMLQRMAAESARWSDPPP